MSQSNKIFSLIYSSPSIDSAKELINVFLKTFDIRHIDADDMFYYAIFNAPHIYANYDFFAESVPEFDVPEELSSECYSNAERCSYVKDIMEQVATGQIKKPIWMMHVEAYSACDIDNSREPSTFLYIYPKDKKYKNLGEKLISFLYSPNLISQEISCDC